MYVIPSDPDALLDRLDILLASKAAGNTGVRNEIVSICDELLRQKVLSRNHYKNLICLLLAMDDIKKQYIIGGSGIFDSIFKRLTLR